MSKLSKEGLIYFSNLINQNIVKRINTLKEKMNKVEERAEHDNREVLDNFSETGGQLLYKNELIKGSGDIDTSEFVTKEEFEENNKKFEHQNIDVLNLLSADGDDLLFKGKKVNSIILGDNNSINNGSNNSTVNLLNVKANAVHLISLKQDNNMCNLIVQPWEFREGQQDIITIIKSFNNSNKNNFYFDKNNISFDEKCKIKDKFQLPVVKNRDNHFVATINKNNFFELVEFEGNIKNND